MDIFGLDKTSSHPQGLVLLSTVYDNVQLAVIRSILDGAEIPCLIKERGAGSSVKIITGYSIFGTDIFVRQEDIETAEALLAPLETDEAVDGDADDEAADGGVAADSDAGADDEGSAVGDSTAGGDADGGEAENNDSDN